MLVQQTLYPLSQLPSPHLLFVKLGHSLVGAHCARHAIGKLGTLARESRRVSVLLRLPSVNVTSTHESGFIHWVLGIRFMLLCPCSKHFTKGVTPHAYRFLSAVIEMF